MAWTDNAVMYWSTDNTNWNKITDHNRGPLSITVERIQKQNRMADGTLRRYSVSKKRTFNVSWDMIPSKRNATYGGKTGITTVDGGWAGEDIETFHNANNGRIYMKLRKGADEAKAISDGTIETVQVMISDFSKEIVKRGIVDFWSLSITMEEI